MYTNVHGSKDKLRKLLLGLQCLRNFACQIYTAHADFCQTTVPIKMVYSIRAKRYSTRYKLLVEPLYV